MKQGVILPDGNSRRVEEIEQIVFLTVNLSFFQGEAISKVLFYQCYWSVPEEIR